mmetsp:Transcript_33495/g.78307  ORF Transcript_33495/g.78307 Transcript_33495/m.78307 type:complete len:538 (-) Transcript_33495:21-1634(-)
MSPLSTAMRRRCEIAELTEGCVADARVPRFLQAVCAICLTYADFPPRPFPSEEIPALASPGAERALKETELWDAGGVTCASLAQDGVQEMSDMALELLLQPSSHLQHGCPIAWWSAVLVNLQYSLVLEPLRAFANTVRIAMEWFATEVPMFDLYPFPFWSVQRSLAQEISFHMRFLGTHHFMCASSDEEKSRSIGKFSKRAELEAKECAVSRSTAAIIERCEAGLAGLKKNLGIFAVMAIDEEETSAVPLSGLPKHNVSISDIDCPSESARDAFEALMEEQKGTEWPRATSETFEQYHARATSASETATPVDGIGCESATAEWAQDNADLHKCVLVTALERLRLQPGARVLDWGSGCGHKLSWATQMYAIEGLGIDLVGESVDWARKHSLGKYCHVDGRHLSWLPRDYFDVVISFAALKHLPAEQQCEVMMELVTHVRPGGEMWFGWNTPNIGPESQDETKHPELRREEFWSECFVHASNSQLWVEADISVVFEIIPEAYLFVSDRIQVKTFLFNAPAYSLFITRTSRALQRPLTLA